MALLIIAVVCQKQRWKKCVIVSQQNLQWTTTEQDAREVCPYTFPMSESASKALWDSRQCWTDLQCSDSAVCLLPVGFSGSGVDGKMQMDANMTNWGEDTSLQVQNVST